ncbi:MAG: family oxidoreductase [Myxococcaceae bacterium]|nr:family oxidoreductase [Myxococcaceae bacterium]
MDAALKTQVLEFDQVKGSMTEDVDVVVVGTGCGGAVMAKELAKAGKSVLMIERGGFYLIERGDFDQREDDMFARIDGGRGLDASRTGQLALTYGSNVGGASVHYWADTWRTPKDRLEKWEREFGVIGHTEDELRPYFDRIEKDLNVHPAEDARLNTMNRLFEVGARAAGIGVERVMQARKGCVGSGYCMQGCSFDAKQSQLVTHLPEALAAGARIFADTQIDRVRMEQGRAVGVVGRFLDRATGHPSGHTLTVKAKVVIIAAGGFHSAPLLLRSGVTSASGQLGRNLMVNPCPQLFGLFDQDIVMWRNIPAGVGSRDLRLHRFEGGQYQEGGYLLYPNQLPPAMLAALLPGFGASHRKLMDNAHRLGSAIAWIDDQAGGSVSLDDELNPVWDYELQALDRLTVRDALKKEAAVLFHAGAKEVIIPDPPGTRLRGLDELTKIDAVDVTAIMYAAPHPSSMCRMGKDPATSVVDCDNQVHGVKGLYVCDPSVFPTAVSVDPSETIMAFSYLAAAKLLASWG